MKIKTFEVVETMPGRREFRLIIDMDQQEWLKLKSERGRASTPDGAFIDFLRRELEVEMGWEPEA